jgi:hypothetical protein
VQKLIRKAYWDYIENIITPKETDDTQYGTMKKHRKTDFNGITEIKHDGKLLTDPCIQKANALNNQFYSVFTPVSNISRTDFNKQCNMPPSTQHPKITHLTIKTEGIQLLCNLNPSKAAGLDEIKPKLLKELSVEIAPNHTILFNKSVTTGIVPSYWRTAHVSPVYKKGIKYNPENYRPISLTCICCKLLEHLIVKHIMSHADTHNILYPLQHGFCTGR